MNQDYLLEAVPVEKLSLLSKEELITFYKLEQDLRFQLQDEVKRLRYLTDELRQKTLLLGEQYVTIKNKLFGKSSEREPSKEDRKKIKAANGRKKVLLPSLRYPDAPLIERRVELDKIPSCKCCNNQMKDSGMTENSEFLTSIPAQHLVIRLMRAIYRCD